MPCIYYRFAKSYSLGLQPLRCPVVRATRSEGGIPIYAVDPRVKEILRIVGKHHTPVDLRGAYPRCAAEEQ